MGPVAGKSAASGAAGLGLNGDAGPEGFGSGFSGLVDTQSVTGDELIDQGIVSGADSANLSEEDADDPQD